jgi:co-chaperonin GroES (HSP10)
MREVKPVGSKLYVRLLQEAKTQSGLVIVRKKQEWQEETLTALVCSTGSTFSYEEIKPGTEIIIAGHAGKWVDPYLTNDPDAIFRMIDQDEIIGYIEGVPDA